jgi:hypothetical protein
LVPVCTGTTSSGEHALQRCDENGNARSRFPVACATALPIAAAVGPCDPFRTPPLPAPRIHPRDESSQAIAAVPKALCYAGSVVEVALVIRVPAADGQVNRFVDAQGRWIGQPVQGATES